MLRVKLFAQARQLAGSSEVEIPWTDGECVSKLKSVLTEQHPKLGQLMPRLLVAVNNEYADDERVIDGKDEVACFPPVSGG